MTKTLYVTNVAHASDLGVLEDLFLTVGDIQRRHLELIPESSAQTFGVFEMLTEQQAADCVLRFHGHDISGRRISVATGRPKARPVPAPVAVKAKRKARKSGC